MLDFNARDNLRKTDRTLVLEPVDGKVLNTSGLLDHRLFKGENNLHAIQDTNTTLWSLAYEKGSVPQQLRQQFTSFKTLKEFVETYFKRRGVVIKEIKD